MHEEGSQLPFENMTQEEQREEKQTEEQLLQSHLLSARELLASVKTKYQEYDADAARMPREFIAHPLFQVRLRSTLCV